MPSNPFKREITSDRLAINRLRARVRNLERSYPRPGAWQYATPTAPATPSDESDSTDGNPFKNGWQNIALPDGSYSPLRWRINHAGRVELVGAIDGGGLNTVCVTLPSLYRPLEDVLATVSSTDGSRVMTVKIDSTTGDVTVVGVPEAAATVGDGQVGTAQLADGSVTTAKLADGAVTSAKIADGTIETVDIADGAVTPAKMAASGVTAGIYGDATHVPQITVDAEGLVTAASDVAISGGGGGITDLASPGGTITVTNPTGPTADIDLPASGVTAGAYGDATHVPAITIDAEGRITAASDVAITGGGGGGDTLHTVAASGAAQTVDYATADVWDITLTAACTISLSGFTSGQPDFLTLVLRQDATGGRTVTWPTITWIGSGIAPILHSNPGDVDSVVLFSFDGGTTVFGIAQTSASGLRSGTAFPGSPSDGDLFYRTDRRVLYEYDATSTNWLSVERKYVAFGPIENSSAVGNLSHLAPSEKIYIESFVTATDAATTNNATNYWTVKLYEQGASATLLASFSTNTDTVSTWTRHVVTIDLVVDPATYPVLEVNISKTGTPGTLYCASGIIYRTVG